MAEIVEKSGHFKLYSYDSKGRIKQWQIGACKFDDGTAATVTQAGLKDGKLKATRRPAKGKNIGKSNETSPYDQAVKEAAAKNKKKMDEGYVTDITKFIQYNFPMKAATYEDPNGKKSMKHHVTFPCHGSPKLNGVRAIGEDVGGATQIFSKKRKDYTAVAKHLAADLDYFMADGKPLDGEIYKHGWTLQEISRAIKKYRPGITEQLEFHIYDVVAPQTTPVARDAFLDDLFDEAPAGSIKRNPWVVLQSHKEIETYHDECVKNGYEGCVVRCLDTGYEIDKRSLYMQKVKLGWQDGEFEIIGGKAEITYTGEDNEIEHKCIVYHCRDREDPSVEFDCRPQGSIQHRASLYARLSKDIGKDLTVRYFSRNEDNNLEFPIGLVVRDYE